MTHLLGVRNLALLAALVAGTTLAGCTSSPTPKSQAKANDLHTQCQQALADFRQKDPGIDNRMRDAYAYAIFPSIGAGAVGVGGAYGKGEVYEQGRLVGYADVSKANVGAQLGGQEYSQLMLFENKAAFTDFRDGKLALDAKASAIAASSGASTSANYQRGVIVFTDSKGGLMAQAAVGGQNFRFTPLDQANIRPDHTGRTASDQP